MKDVWHLQDLDWLTELSGEEREALRARSIQRRYEAGEIVFMPVPKPESVYLLEEGLVRIPLRGHFPPCRPIFQNS